MSFTAQLLSKIRGLSLAQKFLALAALPVGINAYIMGDWVVKQVASHIIHIEGTSTALYVDAFIEPLLQDLAVKNEPREESIRKLDELIRATPVGRRIATLKIWTPDGTVVYSNRPGVQGTKYPLTSTQKRAFAGEVVAEFDDLDDEENVQERKFETPLLEIYAPVRRTGTDSIVAVAEIYGFAGELHKTLQTTRIKTWLIVSSLSVAMLGLLFGIVKRGSRTIDQQRQDLQERLEAQQHLLAENKQLGASLEAAHRRAAESTERFMRRVGSDLHDGPAQSIGLAALHLGDLQDRFEEASDAEAQGVAAKTRLLLSGALDQIRHLAAGLVPTIRSD